MYHVEKIIAEIFGTVGATMPVVDAHAMNRPLFLDIERYADPILIELSVEATMSVGCICFDRPITLRANLRSLSLKAMYIDSRKLGGTIYWNHLLNCYVRLGSDYKHATQLVRVLILQLLVDLASCLYIGKPPFDFTLVS